MATTYTTIQGETWDVIALKVYGGEEYAAFLMENNYAFLDILVFSSGTVLNTPGLPEEAEGELPPWRTEADEDDDEEEDPYDDYDEEEDGDE